MTIEIAVSDPRTKQRLLRVLTDLGHRACSGSVRLAHPCTVLVDDVDPADASAVTALARSVDRSATLVAPWTPLAPAC